MQLTQLKLFCKLNRKYKSSLVTMRALQLLYGLSLKSSGVRIGSSWSKGESSRVALLASYGSKR